MLADQWRRLREAYDALMDAPELDRPRLLDEFSGSDPALGQELKKLLAAEATPGFMDRPLARLVAPRLEPGAILCDRFTLLRPVGQGGMGEVWAARDQKLNEDVAIKMVRIANEAPQDLRRFTREIQLARRISHPNVCRVYEFFEDVSVMPPRTFLTMELLEGETLAARVKRLGPMPAVEALAVFRQMALGLAAAHEAGVIHRDLKPANIMLTTGSSTRQAVVMDFGLARDHVQLESDGATTPGTLVGTPEYMAPEQVSGGEVTPATDVYALGLTLFEMLRGTRPFASSSTLDSWMRRAREGPEKLSGAVPGVQARVDNVIRACLEYEPARRPQTIAQLLRALDSSLYIPVPRSRRFWGAAAAAVIAALVVGGWLGWNRFRPVLPSAEALKWYEDAQEALAEGASVRALNAINRAIELGPEFAPSHAALAEIRLELDMPGAAQEAMLRANELARNRDRLPDAYLAYMDGIQALLQHQCAAAIAHFKRVVETSSPAARPFRMVTEARAMERCDRPDDAQASMAEAARIDPRNAAVPLRMARLAARRRDYAAAAASLAVAERLFLDRGNVEGAGDALIMRATFEAEQERLDDAEATLVQASEVTRGLDQARQSIRVMVQQAIVKRKRGDIEEARRLTESALSQARDNNLETLTLEGLFAAGNVHMIGNQFAEAEALFRRALTIAETYRHDEYRARAQLSLASASVETMHADAAARLIEPARAYYARVGHRRNLAVADALAGEIMMMRLEFAKAIELFEQQVQSSQTAGDAEQRFVAQQRLAVALAGAGRYSDALAQLEEVAHAHSASGRRRSEAFAVLWKADVLSRLGRVVDAEKAIAAVKAMRPLARELDAQLSRVEAAAALRRGSHAEALAAARRALALGTGLSPWRTTRARIAQCVAATAAGNSGEGDAACAAALSATEGLGYPALRCESLLAAAEARLLNSDRPGARALLDQLFRLVPNGSEFEEWWRALALAHAAQFDPERLGTRDRVTRELDSLRLKWGDSVYFTWARRADVERWIKVS